MKREDSYPALDEGQMTTMGKPNDRDPAGVGSLLTPRQREILKLVAEGKSTKEVALLLGLSVKTAETHRSNIMSRLHTHSVVELVRYAIRNDIVQA